MAGFLRVLVGLLISRRRVGEIAKHSRRDLLEMQEMKTTAQQSIRALYIFFVIVVYSWKCDKPVWKNASRGRLSTLSTRPTYIYPKKLICLVIHAKAERFYTVTVCNHFCLDVH